MAEMGGVDLLGGFQSVSDVIRFAVGEAQPDLRSGEARGLVANQMQFVARNGCVGRLGCVANGVRVSGAVHHLNRQDYPAHIHSIKRRCQHVRETA